MKFRSVCFFFLFTILAASCFSQDQTITVYYYERMPFWGQINAQDEGILLAITRQIFLAANIPFVFEKMPINRIFEALKKPGPFCFAGMFRNAEREKTYLFSDYPIYQDNPPHYLIRKSDETGFAKLDTIRKLLTSNKKLGRVNNYSYGTWVDENIKKYEPDTELVNIGDDQASFYRMLSAGRFDYFFASPEESYYLIGCNAEFTDLFSIKEITDAPAGNIRWMIFSKEFPPDLLRRINKAIPVVRESKEYKSLIDGIKK